MLSFKTVDEYILNAGYGKEILIVLREIILSSGLKETIKWGGPVYTFEGKNIAGIGSFKSYSGLWFYQGALLNDKTGVLINAQEDVTKALRQWRFNSADEIDEKLVLQFIGEAVQNLKKGKEIKPDRNKPVVIPAELHDALNEDPELGLCFNRFTPGRQREFADFVSSAKQTETRKTRVQKVIPLILDNIGLNDKYKK